MYIKAGPSEITIHFTVEILKVRKSWTDFLHERPQILSLVTIPSKLSVTIKRKQKTLSDRNRLKGFMTTKPFS